MLADMLGMPRTSLLFLTRCYRLLQAGAPAGSPALGMGPPAVFPPAMSAEAAKPHRKHKRKRDPEEPKPNKVPLQQLRPSARSKWFA